MEIESVKCSLTCSTTNSVSTSNATCSVSDSSVMTNVCSPVLAHSAQTHSPTRPQSSLSPSMNITTSADTNNSTTTTTSVLNNNHLSAMSLQSNEKNSLISSSVSSKISSSQPNTDLNQSIKLYSNNSDSLMALKEERPNSSNIIKNEKDDYDDDSINASPPFKISRTSTAVSPSSSPNHSHFHSNHNSSISNLSSSPSTKENDRKELNQLEEILTEKNSKIKQLEDQLAKQRDYEQIKIELNILKERINSLSGEKPFDFLIEKTKNLQSENAVLKAELNNCLPKQLLPNIQNMNMFTSLLGEELVRDTLFRGQSLDTRSPNSATSNSATENNLAFNNNGSANLLEAANNSQRISPSLRRPHSADELKNSVTNSNSNQSANSNITQNNITGLTPEAFAALDNELILAKNNPSISQLTTSISNSLLSVNSNGQYLGNNSNLSSITAPSLTSNIQIPQLDPMLTVTTPAAQAALTKLTEKLRHNVDRYMNQNLNTQNISRCVRELLSVHNIGQRLFAKYVLGLSQGTVSELLSKPKQWDKLTEKGRDSYRKMHAWASDEDCIFWLKLLVPKKGKEVYNSSMISSTMTNTASMISGNSNNSTNNSSSSAIQNLAGALANGNPANNLSSIAAAAAALSSGKEETAERLQALFKSQPALFGSNNNGLNNSNNSSNPMFDLMNGNNTQSHQQLMMDLLLKSQSQLVSQNQNGNNQNIEADCSEMSDEIDSKEQSSTPLDAIYKKLSNGNQSDSMQDAMNRIYQEQITKLITAQMEENLRQQQSNNNNESNKSDELRQVLALYQHEMSKISSGSQPSIETLNRLQSVANAVNQSTSNQERLFLREGNVSRDSISSSIEESKGQTNLNNSLNNNLNNNNNQSSNNSAFPMVKNFLNNSNNGSNNVRKGEDSCSSGKSTPNDANNNSSTGNSGQPEDLSSIVSSPLQRIQSITNSLLTHNSNPSTSPNRGFPSNNVTPGQSKAILPPITQHQFDLYNNLNTEEIVKKVKEQLSQFSISQRLFGESVLGLSQGSVSDLLARPKPWHMLTQKGREPFIRMRMFLEDENAVHKLVASQYKIAPDKLMRTGNYSCTGQNTGSLPAGLNDLNQLGNLSSLAALSGNLPSNAISALMDNSSIAAAAAAAAAVNGNSNGNQNFNAAAALASLIANTNNRQLNLDTLKLLELHQSTSPTGLNNSSNFPLGNSLLDSTNTQRSSANSTPDRRSPIINSNSPNSQNSLFSSSNKRSASGQLSLNGLNSNSSNVLSSTAQSINKASYNQSSVYEMAALTADLDTQVVTTRIKETLMQHNIGQKIFGEVVLGLSQGSVSELLSKPKPWPMLSIKGREPFIRMQLWLTDSQNIDKLQTLKNERREANKRRRNADGDQMTFTMDKLMSSSNSGHLENGNNDLYSGTSNVLNNFSSNNNSASINNLLANLNSNALNNNSNQFNLSNSCFGPQNPKKPRILFSDEQKEALKLAFQLDSYPTTSTIEFLANELQLSIRTITNWFHNHRMRLKQVSSTGSINNASSPDENSSNYSFNSNGRENSNNTFDQEQFRKLLFQRLNELKLNPANTTQSTIQMTKGNNSASSRFSNAFTNIYSPQLAELIRNNGGDLTSIMNSLTNNCASPSSSNYHEDDDTCMDDEEQMEDAEDHNESMSNNVFSNTLDLSMANNNGNSPINNALKQQSRQNFHQRLNRRNHSEDECNFTENEDDEMQTNDLDDDSDGFDNNILQEKRSKLMLISRQAKQQLNNSSSSSSSSRRKTAQPQWVNPKNNSEENETEANQKQLNDQELRLARSDEESSMHSIEAQ